jgi:hypothetical protein
MKKYDLAIEATKIITEYCTKAKLRFAESINSYSSSNPSLFPSLPQKREASPQLAKPCTSPPAVKPPSSPPAVKPSTSPTSEEAEYDPASYAKVKNLIKTSLISEEELARVYSSDLSSDNEDKSLKSVPDLERLVSLLQNSNNQKQDLELVSKFLDSFSKMGLKERQSLAQALGKLDSAKCRLQDPQIKAIWAEVQGKSKKVLFI